MLSVDLALSGLSAKNAIMASDRCIVCENYRKANPLAYHRFPANLETRARWLEVFGQPHCSRHFRDGDPKNGPDVRVGKRFASPAKKAAPRTKELVLDNRARISRPCPVVDL